METPAPTKEQGRLRPHRNRPKPMILLLYGNIISKLSRMRTLPARDVVCWPGKLEGPRKSDRSFFGLLLEIESRLRKEARNELIEQRQRSKEIDGQRSRINNTWRYQE
jgi:hypothetical protein